MKELAKKGTPPQKPALAPQSAATSYDTQWLLGLYRRMVLIRQFEERVKFLFLEGVMPGTIHQYQGQEACGVGVCAALHADDVITTTHRPHGHCIAKGMDVNSAMAELFGKVTGCCKGKGGSMHMGDLSLGIVPAVAIVGGGLPLTTGMALAFKMRKQPRVAVGFMGDGATNEGAFHEGGEHGGHLGPARAVRGGEQPLWGLHAGVDGGKDKAHFGPGVRVRDPRASPSTATTCWRCTRRRRRRWIERAPARAPRCWSC